MNANKLKFQMSFRYDNYLIQIFLEKKKLANLFANNGDPNQTPHFGVSRLIWVNILFKVLKSTVNRFWFRFQSEVASEEL